MAEILCFSCTHFAPALAPNIAKAFIGGCKKWEAPFTLMLTGHRRAEERQRLAAAASDLLGSSLSPRERYLARIIRERPRTVRARSRCSHRRPH